MILIGSEVFIQQDELKPLGVFAYLCNEIEQDKTPKYLLFSIVNEFIRRGVLINDDALDSSGNKKSFIHHYYNFIKKTGDWKLFYDLISGKNGFEKAVDQYPHLILDQSFLNELIECKEWDILTKIRKFSMSKCADQAEIKKQVNNPYRTELCLNIFKWNTEDKNQTKDILLGAINSQAMHHVLCVYTGWEVRGYKYKNNYNNYVTLLVENLLEDGVDLNRHEKDQLSFLHQYYLFEKSHPNDGKGFLQICALNKKLIIDEALLYQLLNDNAWYFLYSILEDIQKIGVVKISFQFHADLKQAIHDNKSECQDELQCDEEGIKKFLEYANQGVLLYAEICKLQHQFMLFRRITDPSYYLPTEIQDIVINNSINIFKYKK
jgi:hypothetical protein